MWYSTVLLVFGVFVYTVYIYNHHLDGYGHVNNARYLEFLEEARWHFFREHHMLPLISNMQLVVTQIKIRYKYAAVRDDTLSIATYVTATASRQISLYQHITTQTKNYCVAEAEITLIPTHNGKATRMPDELIQQLHTLIGASQP